MAAARTSLLRASEALQALLQACTRARAVIENAPTPERLAGAVDALTASHRAADAALHAARQRIETAAAVVAQGGSGG